MSETDKRDTTDAASPGESLFDTLEKVRRNLELGLHVWQPATIVSYDAATQQARVMLGFLPVEDTGALETPDPPIEIEGVRVNWPKTATSYDHWPLVPGDTGIVLFADRALDEWYRKGGAVDPVDGRAHSLADAVFIPGLGPDTTAISPAPSPTARVIEAPQIKLGSGATDFVALAAKVLQELQEIRTWALTHVHPTAPVGPVSPPSPTAPPLAPVAASVAATKAQAE